MSFDANALLGIGYGALMAAFVLYVVCLMGRDAFMGRLARAIQAFGCVFIAGGLIWQLVSANPAPVIGLREFCLLVAVVCNVFVLALRGRADLAGVAVVVLLLTLGFVAYAMFGLPAGERLAATPNLFYLLYVSLAALAYGVCVSLGSIGALRLAVQLWTRLGHAGDLAQGETLFALHRRSLPWGLLLLSIALVAGMTYRWLSTGVYWDWRPAEVSMLGVLASYAALLHFDRWRGWAVASTVGLPLIAFASLTLML